MLHLQLLLLCTLYYDTEVYGLIRCLGLYFIFPWHLSELWIWTHFHFQLLLACMCSFQATLFSHFFLNRGNQLCDVVDLTTMCWLISDFTKCHWNETWFDSVYYEQKSCSRMQQAPLFKERLHASFSWHFYYFCSMTWNCIKGGNWSFVVGVS